VIATAVGGTPEVITDGETGLLIPPRDSDALAGALERLLVDPEWAKEMGARARGHVEANYSLDRFGRELNAIYEELIEKKFGVRD
jgi:glycosyltransferase involved in cell wall biosynthesis